MTAGLTGMDPNVKEKCFAAFRLRTKGLTLICIYGECNAILGFITLKARPTDSHRGQKIFSLPRVVPCFPLLGLTPSWLFMGLSSTLIYTSELILCSTICVPSATRHNIHMYPYFLFAATHHLKIVPDFLCATL